VAESYQPVRDIVVSLLLAAFMAGGMQVLVSPPHLPGTPNGLVLGHGAWELASAARLRRWERRNGRQLLSEMFWSTPSGFYAR
jgi:hypothetical protein